ncbi:MAG: hypothetical protein OEO79_04570 [Gemmatimonadota bacterium]|nr:hypothetical protein [Gemmatimonadota bacterium]MDH3421861.1 hypothetical protein [Gemmatimonadota bacterium]
MATEEAVTEPSKAAAVACHEPFHEAWTELGGSLEHGVMAVVRAGTERHREVIQAQGLDQDPPSEWKVRAERLLEYRRVLDADLLGPLHGLFSGGGPTAIIARALEGAFEEAATRCEALPAGETVPWPDGALSSAPSDRLGRRFGKVLAKVFSGARRAGGERTLPLRGAVADHIDRFVVPGQNATGSAALIAWGGWSHRLELALVRWGAIAVPALVRAERPEEDDGAEVWSAVREAAGALQASLDTLIAEEPLAEALAAARQNLGSCRSALEADLAVAGSFLFEPKAEKPSSSLRDLANQAEALQDWDAGVGARVNVYIALLGILSGATAVRRRTVWQFRDRCLASVTELNEIAATLDALHAELVQPGEYGLGTRLEEVDAAVSAALEPAGRAIPDEAAVDSALQDLSDTTIEALLAMIRQAPATLEIHDVEAKAPTGKRKAERRPLPIQELARQSFDALRIERIRSSTAGLVDAIDTVRTDVSELGAVYTFARDEALRELESDEPGSGDRADDLVGGALQSIADALRAQVTQLDKAVADAQRRLAAEIADGSIALVDRVEAGRMEARLFAARSRATDLWTWMQERWGPPVQRAWRRVVLVASRVRQVGARILRKGSAMVGSTPPPASSTRTLRALADADASIAGLPLVYQRLFTLSPLSDGVLLAGRDIDLEEAMARWRGWHDDDGVPLIVRARQGTGLTSFLNVLTAAIEKDGGSVKRAALNDRVTDEAGLATYLAQLLGLAPTDSLADLSSAIFEAKASDLPSAVSLDNLEHLYLRVPGGTDLIERLLTLMAETEPRVFWIAGITTSAWKLVAISEPTAVSQVDVFDLKPLDVSAMRTAIMVRHRRSGLAIRYEEPTGSVYRLRRRLQRIRHSEDFQRQLESDFFDRLYRTSGGYLGLALYQWLKSADFTSGEGVLMRQPERPDFSVLDALDLTQNFSLKAFLEHRSLTLHEHDLIFRVSRQESYQVIESLRNRHLLESLNSGGENEDARSEIEEELRYRVRPLLMGAVISHLQGRNIVH